MSPANEGTSVPRRLDVRKTYKLYIDGSFPRSESGRTYLVEDAKGEFVANAACASRKDARNAVRVARKAFGGWSARTPYNRAQILYRVAEVLEGRRAQLVDEVQDAEGGSRRQANSEVDTSLDRLVWYAGWADKVAQVLGATNPVAGPYFNFSLPEPTGVVAVLAPQQSSLLGLISVLGPVMVTGNTCVIVSSVRRPIPAVTLAEVLATSDVPGGVVNILTGNVSDVALTLAAHMDVNALDLAGSAGDPDRAKQLEEAAAENLKRVLRAPSVEADWTVEPDLTRMAKFVETKTVWHPIGV